MSHFKPRVVTLIPDALDILGMDGDNVLFSLNQLWNTDDEVKMVSVKYRDTINNDICDKNMNVTSGAMLTYHFQCVDGFEPYTDDGTFPLDYKWTNSNGYLPGKAEPITWENGDYFELVVSSVGFYVATIEMKVATENTLSLANAYTVGTMFAGIIWTVWNPIQYCLFIRDDTEAPAADPKTGEVC